MIYRKITACVLEQKGVFTLEDVANDLVNKGVFVNRSLLRHRLKTLRDIGIIYEQGSYYEVI